MAADAKLRQSFDPAAFQAFRFTSRELDARGRVTLRYALDDELTFVEELELPVAGELGDGERERVDGLLSLLHWVAGVSYFKTAAPAQVICEAASPPPAAAALLEALYSEGLGEFAYTNSLAELPRPRFARTSGEPPAAATRRRRDEAGQLDADGPRRILVPVGGGKDSAVALEIARRSGRDTALFSIGDAPPIARTVAVAGLPHLLARRRLDPSLAALNAAGALNGHVPITAIVSCVAALTAALNRFDSVAMANERSASAGNLAWGGIEVNHQFSKGLRAERLLSAALAELDAGVECFSILRPASELAIARAFARLERYHAAFTSCNAIFRLDPALRASSWCRDCPKCRFVFLALAPFSSPEHLRAIFGADLLADDRQYDGFALLTASGGHKPFECVGEEQESLAAIRLLAEDPRWSGHSVVRRLVTDVLSQQPPSAGDPAAVLALSDEHDVPAVLMADVRALLELDGARIGVWGAGREVRAFADVLARRLPSARILAAVFDVIPDEDVRGALSAPEARLASAPEALSALSDCEVVVRSPGVSAHRPELAALRAAGVPVTTATSLWLAEHGGAGVIGITGTKGKSTTAALASHLARAAGREVRLAGNIGVPAIELLDDTAAELVVLELSSYQIADLQTGPEVALVTNLFREHTDWHGSEQAYRADKLRLLALPGVRTAVLNARDPALAALTPAAALRPYGTPEGWDAQAGGVAHAGRQVLGAEQLPLRGEHNALNLCGALTALEAIGLAPPASLERALRGFAALAHRLETILERDGVAWVDDSISTTPESTLAALASFPGRDVVLIGGGQDRGQDYGELGRALAASVAAVIGVPSTGPRLLAAARAGGLAAAQALEAADLREAVALARGLVPRGGVVLLSPAAPSYDHYRDFEQRGERFRELAAGE